ncbi:hypothetical protein ACJZ2D_006603 [Fusarium nematophilum]
MPPQASRGASQPHISKLLEGNIFLDLCWLSAENADAAIQTEPNANIKREPQPGVNIKQEDEDNSGMQLTPDAPASRFPERRAIINNMVQVLFILDGEDEDPQLSAPSSEPARGLSTMPLTCPCSFWRVCAYSPCYTPAAAEYHWITQKRPWESGQCSFS